MNDDKIHVLLADDDFHWAEDIRKMFVLEPSLKMVGVAQSGQDAVDKAGLLKPDVVLISLDLPGEAMTVIQHMKKANPYTVFIGQLNNNDQNLYQQAMNLGVRKVILKSAITTGEILNIIKQIWEESKSNMQIPSQPQPIPPSPQFQATIQGYPQNPYQPQVQQQPMFPNYPKYPQPNPYMQPNTNQQMTHPPYTQNPQMPYPNYQPPFQQPQQGQHPFVPNGINPFQQVQGVENPNLFAPRIRTTTIAFNSPKGGVGKSTLSKELAAAYAMVKIPTAPGQPEDRLKVCLVDMDLDYGNIAAMLRLNPIPNISTWAEDINDRIKKSGDNEKIIYAPDQFMPYLLTHVETGLKVLAAPVLPTQALDINERVVEIIIDSLKAYFDVVILDTGNNTRDYTLVALDKAQKVVVVSTLEVPTVNNVHALLETLKQIHYPTEKLSLVINDVSKKGNELKIDDVVRVLEIPFLGTIPEDPRVKQANNKGEVLVMAKETEFTSSVRKIGNQLVPAFAMKKKKIIPSKGADKKFDLFGFLKKK